VSAAEGLPLLPVRIETYISLMGRSTALINMPAYTWEDSASATHLRTDGTRGRVKFGQGRFKGEWSGPRWEFGTAGEAFGLYDSAFEFGGEQREETLQTRIEGTLSSLMYHPIYLPDALHMVGIKIRLSVFDAAALLSANLEIDAQPASGGKMRLAGQIERLDIGALLALLQTLEKPVDRTVRAWYLMQAASALLASQPRIHLDSLHLDTPAGALTGRLELRYQPPEGVTPANFLLALPYLEAEGAFVVPRGALEYFAEWRLRRAFFQDGQAPPAEIKPLAQTLAAQWRQAGQAYLTGEQEIRLDFSLRQGKLRLNGQETPLQALFQGLVAAR